MKKPLLLVFTLLLGLSLTAAEKVKVEKLTVKVLPADVYAKLAKGKKLSLVWKDEAFAPARGFKIGDIEWKAENRVGEVLDYLKEQPKMMGTKDGYYTLDLIVTEAMQGNIGYFGNKTGYFILEGRAKDPDGKILAVFVTKEEDEFGNMAKTLKPGVDRAMTGVTAELFK